MSKPLLLYVLLAYDTQPAEGSDEVCFDLDVDTDFNRLKAKADEYIGNAKGMDSVCMEVQIYSTDDIAGMKVHYADSMGYNAIVQFREDAAVECVYHNSVYNGDDQDEDDNHDVDEDFTQEERQKNTDAFVQMSKLSKEDAKRLDKELCNMTNGFWRSHRLKSLIMENEHDDILAVRLVGSPDNILQWVKDVFRYDDERATKMFAEFTAR